MNRRGKCHCATRRHTLQLEEIDESTIAVDVPEQSVHANISFVEL
jgi:hypothetical protein